MPELHKKYLILKLLPFVLLIGGVAKFYHYNYVAHTEHARNLKLPGLHELICKGEVHKEGATDQCGKRGVYGDADWGVTAYFTIYGIESREEAEAIAKFMVRARKKNGQENIPINLQVYSVPRSAGNRGPVDTKYIIFEKDL